MPHDAFGAELKVGDRVKIFFTVKEITPGTDTCDVRLESERARKDGTKESFTTTAALSQKT